MNKTIRRLLTLALLAGMPMLAGAATITWDTPSVYSKGWGAAAKDVSTKGDLVEAFNLGDGAVRDTKVKGVNFIGTSTLLPGPGARGMIHRHGTSDGYYDNLLNMVDIADSVNTTATLTLGGGKLVEGNPYLIQAWFVDTRDPGKVMQFGDGEAIPNTVNVGGSTGQYVTGTFTADATTQTFTVTPIGANKRAHLAAYQIRDLAVIKEPLDMGIPFDSVFDPDKENVDYINPMIGAYGPSGSGLVGKQTSRTIPGPTTPFGLVQLGPDTVTGGDNMPGYSWFDRTIEGFSFTHMSGGGWYGDLGNFLVTPTTGALKTARGKKEKPELGYRSRMNKKTETARAAYYAVTLEDYGVRAELTAAPRSGIIRFTYPKHEQSRIQIDLSRRVAGTSTEQYVQVVDEHTIRGWMKCRPEGGGFGNGHGGSRYTVYFYCQFSKPLEKFGVWSAQIPDGQVRRMNEVISDKYQAWVAAADVLPGQKEYQGKHLGFYTEFPTDQDEVVLLKSGISFASMEGAKLNLENDIPDWDFDKVYKQGRALWADAISVLNIKGGTADDKAKFYTALYRTMLDPRGYSDINGEYIGADNKIHTTDQFTYRTIFSGWDVFRSHFPLLTLISPDVVNDEVNSLMKMAEFSGKKFFPRWEFMNNYTGCMVGNPAVSVIVDAYEKGIRNYDVEKAFAYSKNSVDKFGNGKLGYVVNEISRTMEYAYSDWCLGRFAESLGKKDLAETYYQKSKAYKNIWNTEVQWFRGRNPNGWMGWRGETGLGQGCIECNPLQQGWFVPHDIPGFIDLAGKEYLIKKLNNFFEKAPPDFKLNLYYYHGDEHVHHVPFMFNEFGVPRLTQHWTRRICEAAYGNELMGLVGNDDFGQLSAWYILAASGLHPICPGDNKWQITSPVFDEITLSLDPNYYSGKTFTVKTYNNSKENIIIQKMELNGKPLTRYWLDHKEIINGGLLEIWLDKPDASD